MTSTRVASSAGARPNKTLVKKESTAAAPSTCQFKPACKVNLTSPLAKSRVRKRIPQSAKSMPMGSAERPKQNAFGQQLPDDPEPACSETQSQRDLALARNRAGQQQIGNIDARQGQDQSHQRHQQRIAALSIAGADCPIRPRLRKHKRWNIRALPIIGRCARYPLLKYWRKHGLRLGTANSWTQPPLTCIQL